MVEASSSGVKVALIGATGAIGKEVVRYLLHAEGVTEATLLVRREVELKSRAEDEGKPRN